MILRILQRIDLKNSLSEINTGLVCIPRCYSYLSGFENNNTVKPYIFSSNFGETFIFE